MALHEIFREGWQWTNEQMIKFWWWFSNRFARWHDWYCDNGKMCLGGGMHCPSAFSYIYYCHTSIFLFAADVWSFWPGLPRFSWKKGR